MGTEPNGNLCWYLSICIMKTSIQFYAIPDSCSETDPETNTKEISIGVSLRAVSTLVHNNIVSTEICLESRSRCRLVWTYHNILQKVQRGTEAAVFRARQRGGDSETSERLDYTQRLYKAQSTGKFHWFLFSPYLEGISLSALKACNAVNWPKGVAISLYHWLSLCTLGLCIVSVH